MKAICEECLWSDESERREEQMAQHTDSTGHKTAYMMSKAEGERFKIALEAAGGWGPGAIVAVEEDSR